MNDAQRIVDDLRSVVHASDQTYSDQLTQLAKSYVEACGEANKRLRRCDDFLRQGLRSEAIRYAEAEPSLLDQVAILDRGTHRLKTFLLQKLEEESQSRSRQDGCLTLRRKRLGHAVTCASHSRAWPRKRRPGGSVAKKLARPDGSMGNRILRAYLTWTATVSKIKKSALTSPLPIYYIKKDGFVNKLSRHLSRSSFVWNGETPKVPPLVFWG